MGEVRQINLGPSEGEGGRADLASPRPFLLELTMVERRKLHVPSYMWTVPKVLSKLSIFDDRRIHAFVFTPPHL